MTLIKRNARVEYASRQMFELVNNIEAYPEFLPWCVNSYIISQDEKMVEASLDIAWSHIRKTFTTRNLLYPYERIHITLVQGPLRKLEGDWHFKTIDDKSCLVELDLEFEVGGGLLDKMMQPLFNHIANSLVELFCKRAEVVYGN